jgi:hypothetical protein
MNSNPLPQAGLNQRITRAKQLLLYKKQIILQGPPGTGKTYIARDIAEFMITGGVSPDKNQQGKILEASDCYKLVQFHPSYTYEDFVRGIEVKTDSSSSIRYEVTNRVLAQFAEIAKNNPDKPHVLIIDEINRANLSAVLGELIYALEYRDQAVASMYGIADQDAVCSETPNHQLMLPGNLYIIGTMNTADRSAGHLDYAVRRRFTFLDVLPESLTIPSFHSALFDQVKRLFTTDDYRTRSEYLSEEFRPKDVALGHSYFIASSDTPSSMELRLEYDIKPILFEYVKDGVLKESALERIALLKVSPSIPARSVDLSSGKQLLLKALEDFEQMTAHKFELWSHNDPRTTNKYLYKRVYVSPDLDGGSLHYEFYYDPHRRQITVDFHIESDDLRHRGVAAVLKTLSTTSFGIRGAHVILDEEWEKNRVKLGCRFALSNLDQSPHSLAEAMVKLINNTKDKLRIPIQDNSYAKSTGSQGRLL